MKTILKNFFAKIIGAYLRIQFRWLAKDSPINIVEHLARTKKALIYMPNKIEHFGAALKSLEKLRAKRPDWQITVVTKLELVSFIHDGLHVDILPYGDEDINLFGFPKWSLRKHFRNAAYDLALDFIFNFDLLGLKLLQLSRAPVRVCFDSSEKLWFYNFGIRVNPVEPLVNKYNAMVKYITVISDAHQQPASPQLQ
jgi:ADP-heptose:LPS heptosyltransferase